MPLKPLILRAVFSANSALVRSIGPSTSARQSRTLKRDWPWRQTGSATKRDQIRAGLRRAR